MTFLIIPHHLVTVGSAFQAHSERMAALLSAEQTSASPHNSEESQVRSAGNEEGRALVLKRTSGIHACSKFTKRKLNSFEAPQSCACTTIICDSFRLTWLSLHMQESCSISASQLTLGFKLALLVYEAAAHFDLLERSIFHISHCHN